MLIQRGNLTFRVLLNVFQKLPYTLVKKNDFKAADTASRMEHNVKLSPILCHKMAVKDRQGFLRRVTGLHSAFKMGMNHTNS